LAKHQDQENLKISWEKWRGKERKELSKEEEEEIKVTNSLQFFEQGYLHLLRCTLYETLGQALQIPRGMRHSSCL
jgi:hypothetical protein